MGIPVEQTDFLITVDHGGAIKWVMYRSAISHYRKFYRREMYLEDLTTRSGDPDEFIIDGYEGRFYTGHSDYSRHIDLRIDLERAIQHMQNVQIDIPLTLYDACGALTRSAVSIVYRLSCV